MVCYSFIYPPLICFHVLIAYYLRWIVFHIKPCHLFSLSHLSLLCCSGWVWFVIPHSLFFSLLSIIFPLPASIFYFSILTIKPTQIETAVFIRAKSVNSSSTHIFSLEVLNRVSIFIFNLRCYWREYFGSQDPFHLEAYFARRNSIKTKVSLGGISEKTHLDYGRSDPDRLH